MLFERLKPLMIEHAEQVFPEECLGVVDGDDYVPLKNVSPDPENSFEMEEKDELRYVFPESDLHKCQAVVHSHPDGPLCPSFADMRAQIETGLPFVMIAHSEETGWVYWEMGDHMLDEPLEERPFIHGVTDCWAAVRSWFWQEYAILLPDFPRRDKWWLPGERGEEVENMYNDFWEEAGFRPLDPSELEQGPRRGDGFLYKLNPATEGVAANSIETHGGVYCGDGRIFHHLPNRLSCFDNAEQWGRRASRWMRYVGPGAEKLEPCEEVPDEEATSEPN